MRWRLRLPCASGSSSEASMRLLGSEGSWCSCRRRGWLQLLWAAVLVLLLVLSLSLILLLLLEPEGAPLWSRAASLCCSLAAASTAQPAAPVPCLPIPAAGPSPPEYDVYEGADVEGHDLGMLRTGGTEALRRACDALPDCLGFNSNGWLKRAAWPRAPSNADFHLKRPPAAGPAAGPAAQPPAPSAPSLARAPQYPPAPASSLGFDMARVSPWLQAERAAMLAGSFKLYIYPTTVGTDMPSPADYKYGAEALFLSLLQNSQFVTQDPAHATFFVLPTRCTAYRYAAASRQEGQALAEATAAAMLADIRTRFPYWNRTRGADHVYLCSHDMGTSVAASPLSAELRKNAIALVNTADYNDTHYTPHKDIALPPNIGDGCPTCIQGGQRLPVEAAGDTGGAPAATQSRHLLAFFAGTMDRGAVRPLVYRLWHRDADFVIHDGYLNGQQYLRGLSTAQFCLFLRGHRAWSPRLMDAVWAGCVPVIIADYYDLPLQGIVDWASISVIVPQAQIANLKPILLAQRVSLPQRQAALRAAAHHLTWHRPPLPLDAFECIMIALWRRRHVVRYG